MTPSHPSHPFNPNAVAMTPPELHSQIRSTGLRVLRPTRDLEPACLFLFVQTDDFVRHLSDLAKGALHPAVTDKQVREPAIPLPPHGRLSCGVF